MDVVVPAQGGREPTLDGGDGSLGWELCLAAPAQGRHGVCLHRHPDCLPPPQRHGRPKDPAARPSAADLLEHPFVAGAEAAPPELAQRVAAWLQRRPALLERQAARGGGGYGTVGATMPRWDFAAPASSGGDGAAATPAAAAAAAPPAAADFGTVVRRHTDAGTAGHAGQPQLGDTMQVRPATAAAGLGGVPPPSRLVIPCDPTQPDWATPAGARPYSAAAPSAMAAAPGGGGDGGASRQLLQAGLHAAGAGSGATPAVAAAADTAAAALGQLDAARPGAVRDALTEMLTQLSLANSPALAGLKGSAEALFGGGGGDGGGGQGGGDGMPDLGPLGRFLMHRWRESVARERVQTSQQWPAS